MKALALCLVIAATQAPRPSVEASAVERDDDRTIAFLLLDADASISSSLAPSLRSRLPDATVLPFVEGALEEAGTSSYAYVKVAGADDGTSTITIVLADGRAYERLVQVRGELGLRAIVATVANTIAAIEQERVPADRDNVTIPPPPTEASVPRLEVEVEPQARVVAVPTRRMQRPPPSVEFGVGVRAGPVLGLAPSEAMGLAAGGGELTGAVRWPRAALLTTGVRVTGRPAPGAGLLRTRIAIGGGYDWRRRALEVGVAAAASVEPWIVTGDSLAGDDAERAQRSPLLGGMLLSSVGYRVRTASGISTRVGAFVEFGASAVPEGGAGRVLRSTATGEETVFTLGGIELAAGVDVTLWIPLRR